MAQPIRIKLSRQKGFRLQEHSVALNGLPAMKVDRATIWGNNFAVEDFDSAEECVDMFEHDLAKFSCFHPEKFSTYIRPLVGKNLACWCPIGSPCHAEVLVREAADYARYHCIEVAS